MTEHDLILVNDQRRKSKLEVDKKKVSDTLAIFEYPLGVFPGFPHPTSWGNLQSLQKAKRQRCAGVM